MPKRTQRREASEEPHSEPIDSVRELQRRVPRILKALAADERLSLAAAANPILALERLGHSFTPTARRQVEARIRFGERGAGRLAALVARVQTSLNAEVDIDSPQELSAALAPALSETALGTLRASGGLQAVLSPRNLRSAGDADSDPLAAIAGAHPAIEPLVEYRALQATVPRLAAPERFRSILEGEVRTPVQRVRFRLQDRAARRGVSSE